MRGARQPSFLSVASAPTPPQKKQNQGHVFCPISEGSSCKGNATSCLLVSIFCNTATTAVYPISLVAAAIAEVVCTDCPRVSQATAAYLCACIINAIALSQNQPNATTLLATRRSRNEQTDDDDEGSTRSYIVGTITLGKSIFGEKKLFCANSF